MHIISSLPNEITYLLFGTLFLGLLALPFIIVLLQQKATHTVAQQPYNTIVTNNPKLQPYLNQGYTLLSVVREKGWMGANFSVFNYPNQQTVNTLPLFRIAFELGTPTQLHTTNCIATTNEIISYLPLEGVRILHNTGLFSQLEIQFKRPNQTPLLSITFPKGTLKEAFSKWTICPINSNSIPPEHTWQWHSNNLATEDDKLIEATHNTTLLATTSANAGMAEIIYMVAHPSMPPKLIPPFVHLALLRSNSNS